MERGAPDPRGPRWSASHTRSRSRAGRRWESGVGSWRHRAVAPSPRVEDVQPADGGPGSDDHDRRQRESKTKHDQHDSNAHAPQDRMSHDPVAESTRQPEHLSSVSTAHRPLHRRNWTPLGIGNGRAGCYRKTSGATSGGRNSRFSTQPGGVHVGGRSRRGRRGAGRRDRFSAAAPLGRHRARSVSAAGGATIAASGQGRLGRVRRVGGIHRKQLRSPGSHHSRPGARTVWCRAWAPGSGWPSCSGACRSSPTWASGCRRVRRCARASSPPPSARRLGLGEGDVRDVFYTALLIHVGCVAVAHESTVAFGDDIALNRAVVPHQPGRSGRTSSRPWCRS